MLCLKIYELLVWSSVNGHLKRVRSHDFKDQFHDLLSSEHYLVKVLNKGPNHAQADQKKNYIL